VLELPMPRVAPRPLPTPLFPAAADQILNPEGCRAQKLAPIAAQGNPAIRLPQNTRKNAPKLPFPFIEGLFRISSACWSCLCRVLPPAEFRPRSFLPPQIRS